MAKTNILLRLAFLLVFVNLSSALYSQDREVLVFNEDCSSGSIKIVPSQDAKVKRTSSKNTGVITMDLSNCADMPDSLKVALYIASDVWSGYLNEGDSVNLDIRYDDTNESDISAEVSYLPSVDQIYYPQCLYRKLFPVNNRSAFSYPDAIIHINKNTNWCVGVGDGASSDLKNLAYGMLRSVATALGVGSSVKKDSRNNVVFGFRDGMSVFDKNIFSESGKRMESLSNNSGKEFNDFVQQQNGCLYFYKKEKAY